MTRGRGRAQRCVRQESRRWPRHARRWTTSAAPLLLPLSSRGPGLALGVVGGFGIGAAVVAGNVLKGTFRQTYTPRHLLGRVVVGMQFLNYGTIPLGALFGGTLGTALGLRPTMWIMVVGVALAPLVLLIGPAKRARDFPDNPRVLRERELSAA